MKHTNHEPLNNEDIDDLQFVQSTDHSKTNVVGRTFKLVTPQTHFDIEFTHATVNELVDKTIFNVPIYDCKLSNEKGCSTNNFSTRLAASDLVWGYGEVCEEHSQHAFAELLEMTGINLSLEELKKRTLKVFPDAWVSQCGSEDFEIVFRIDGEYLQHPAVGETERDAWEAAYRIAIATLAAGQTIE